MRPDLILSCGDWGDPDEVTDSDLTAFQEYAPCYSTFGNHDPLDILKGLRNRDGTPVLLPQGSHVVFEGLRIAAIGGIWAKSHAKPHYVTDLDVADAAASIALAGPVDVLLTHGCPIGLADMTPSGRHGGQRCFLEANKTIMPRLHLCGHLHRAQVRILKDGRRVINVGATPDGSFVIVEFDAPSHTLEAQTGAAAVTLLSFRRVLHGVRALRGLAVPVAAVEGFELADVITVGRAKGIVVDRPARGVVGVTMTVLLDEPVQEFKQVPRRSQVPECVAQVVVTDCVIDELRGAEGAARWTKGRFDMRSGDRSPDRRATRRSSEEA